MLAEELDTSIISADSRQCYKHIDIGTAKPTEEELRRVPHYNISILELDEDDSAMDFQRRAQKWEREILNGSEHVVYAGGSTLHLQSLIQPCKEMPDADEENLAKLEADIESNGLEHLYQKLQKVDPVYAQKMDGMNRQRILRALDVWMQTGRPFSSFHQQGDILRWPRKMLYDRINRRVDQMIEAGLVDEVKRILEHHPRDLQALNTVGYKEVFKYLDGEWPLDKVVEKIKTHTRRYAKRQLTWFRRWEFIEWLPAEEMSAKEMKAVILQKL